MTLKILRLLGHVHQRRKKRMNQIKRLRKFIVRPLLDVVHPTCCRTTIEHIWHVKVQRKLYLVQNPRI